MRRIFLFAATNLAVIALLSAVIFLCERAFGLRLAQGGAGELMLFAGVVGFGGALLSLALSKYMAKGLMGVRVIERPGTELEDWLVATVERLAARAQIRMPEVGIFESDEMNAFATGARRNAALVAVSSGLLRGMSRDEVRAVLAHEITHVANGDMVTLALLQGVLNTFVIFLARLIGAVVDRTLFKNDRGESGLGFFVTTCVAQIALGILASVIVSAYSRRREFRADRGSATLAGSGNMIGALEALQRGRAAPLPDQIQAFGITRAGSTGILRWFMSHPPLDERIAALRAAAARA